PVFVSLDWTWFSLSILTRPGRKTQFAFLERKILKCRRISAASTVVGRQLLDQSTPGRVTEFPNHLRQVSPPTHHQRDRQLLQGRVENAHPHALHALVM